MDHPLAWASFKRIFPPSARQLSKSPQPLSVAAAIFALVNNSYALSRAKISRPECSASDNVLFWLVLQSLRERRRATKKNRPPRAEARREGLFHPFVADNKKMANGPQMVKF